MSLNSHEYHSNQNVFVEKIIDTPFKIKKNPEGIPLINGDNVFPFTDGEDIELTKNDKISQYGDKILIETENAVYFKDEGKTVFEKINFDAKGIFVNHKSFERYGQVFMSSFIDGGNGKNFYTHWIDGEIYTMPIGEGSMRFGDDICDVQIKGNKIYAHWGISADFNVYTINKESHKLILDSKYTCSTNDSLGFMLDNNSFLEKYVKDNKTVVKTNTNYWKNEISGYGSSINTNGKDVRLWNGNELVINDKKYPLGSRKGEMRNVQLSENGQQVMISYNYDKYNSNKEGYHILLGNTEGIQKEIPNTFGWVVKMIIQDENTFAYVTKNNDKEFTLVINGYDYPISLQDSHDAIKEFSFVDVTTVNIKYTDDQKNLIHKHVSLDSHAEEIQKRQEQVEQEKKSEFEMMNWLKEHDISSREQLQKLFDDAGKADRYSQNLQEEQKSSYEKTLEIDQLKSEKNKLTNENSRLITKNQELEGDMNILKTGITSGALGYKLSSDAKKILGK